MAPSLKMGSLTEADRWLLAYAAEHGYAADFEPDWDTLFGKAFLKDPDFLVQRDGARAIVESRGFESWAFTEFMQRYRPRGGTVPPGVTLRPIYAALKEKSEQLLPFGTTGEPLVIALANPGASDVMLDDHHVQSAMFGNLAVSVPISGAPGESESPPMSPQMVVQPGYGAFCATDASGNPQNPRAHVSGVAVFGRHDLYAEFQRQDLRRFIESRTPQSHEDRLQAGADWLGTAIAQGEADGPTGFEYSVTYYDLDRFGLGHGPAVPEDWFDGPRDRRFAFDATGTQFGLVKGDAQLG